MFKQRKALTPILRKALSLLGFKRRNTVEEGWEKRSLVPSNKSYYFSIPKKKLHVWNATGVLVRVVGREELQELLDNGFLEDGRKALIAVLTYD